MGLNLPLTERLLPSSTWYSPSVDTGSIGLHSRRRVAEEKHCPMTGTFALSFGTSPVQYVLVIRTFCKFQISNPCCLDIYSALTLDMWDSSTILSVFSYKFVHLYTVGHTVLTAPLPVSALLQISSVPFCFRSPVVSFSTGT